MPRTAGPVDASSGTRHAPYVLGLIFVVLAAGIVAAGYLYFHRYERHYRAEVDQQLSAIAELKVAELVDWRQERLGDASLLFNNAAFAALVRRFLDKPGDVEAQDQLREWLGKFQTRLSYDRVFLLDAQGIARAAVPDTPEPVVAHLTRDAAEALNSGKVSFLDFHRDKADGPICLAVMVPILGNEDAKRPLGIIALRIDPAAYLYPFINRWPTPSSTAESLLVRRDGEDVLFLNELRFRKNTALTLRMPLTRTENPAVMAALGQEGIVEGQDYRGVPVIAAIRAVRDSPWFLVARMDASEVYGPLRERLWLTVVLVGVLLLAAGAGIGLVWRQQNMRFYREKAEVADDLRASEERFRAIASHTPDHILIQDRDLRYQFVVNPQLGLTEADMIGKTDRDFLGPEDAEKLTAIKRKVLETGEPVRVELPIQDSKGETEFFEGAYIPTFNPAGKADGLIGYSRNVTERRRAEAALRESETRFHELFGSINNAVAVYEAVENGADFALRDFNRAAERIEGTVKEAVLGRRVTQVFPGVREMGLLEVLQRVWRTGQPEHWPVTLYRDERISGWRENYVYRLPSGEVVAVYEDVTERKRAEEEMKWTRALLEAQIDATIDGILIVDAKGKKIVQNQRCVELWKIPKHVVDNHDDQQQVEFVKDRAKDPEKFVDKVMYLYAHPNETSRDEVEFKDGMVLDRFSAPVIGKDGTHFGRIWTFRDITDRKRAEDALRQSEERFRTLVEAVTDYAYKVTVQDSRVVESAHGPGCLGVTGYLPEEFQADPELWFRMVHPEDQPAIFDRASKLSSTQKVGPLEHRIIHKNGETRWVRNSAVLRFDQHGQYIGYEGLIQDITAHRKLQERFAQAQKMEAVGQLAGGVAHDFRNQLTVIKGYAEMLLRRDLVKDEAKGHVERILRAADHSATISGQLLAFSRQQTLRPEVISVDSVAGDMMQSLAHTLGEDIQLSVRPSGNLWNIRVDTGQCQQALLNLVLNARDAMLQGGQLTIETENVVLDESFVSRHVGVSVGRYVVLTVSDTGTGMSPETLSRLFEPFFTTKPVGEGTGLGLAMVHGFVAQSGGFIDVQSMPGQGTTFRIYFPAVDDVAEAAQRPAQAPDLSRGSGTVLVVEDEEAIQRMLLETLGECGYTVLTAGNAQEAMALIGSAKNKIDLLITDVVMPGWSGPELAKHFQAARPGVPVLMISSHAGKMLTGHGVVPADVNLLAKPFNTQTLAQTVQKLMGQSTRPHPCN